MQRLPRGVFTLSLDFELAWGSRDLMDDTRALEQAAIRTREEVFEGLLGLLVEREMHATWATVGHLFLGEAQLVKGRLHPDLVPPRHAWHPGPWLDGVPAGSESSHPAWYGRSLVERLVGAGQEIGSHGFTHAIFGDPGCSAACAESELRHAVEAATALGLELRSFVFPRNQHGHLDLLARYGFLCWRPLESARYRRPGVPGSLVRLGHLMDVARGAPPATVLPVQGAHGLWEIPASASFLPLEGIRRLVPMRQRVARCIKGLEAAAASGRVFHLYLHPINLAAAPRAGLQGLARVFDHAARLRAAGRLEILPMAALASGLRSPVGGAPSGWS